MALGPQSITVDHTVINKVFDTIDAKIKDPTYMQAPLRGPLGVPSWIFVGPGSLTPHEKAYIKVAYLNVGWQEVEVKNSDDNGERPGLWSVTLGYKPSEQHQ